MPNPSKPTCNFSARIDADLMHKYEAARYSGGLHPTNRDLLEALLRYWLTLSDAERAALLEARDAAK